MPRVNVIVSRPWWWKPIWIAILLSTTTLYVFDFFLSHSPLERVTGALVLTFMMISIAYYIRIKPSRRVNRGLYILLGFSPIGFSLWLLYAFSGIGRFLTTIGLWGSLASMLLFPVPFIMGAFIGDWIGKRYEYRIPFSLPNEVPADREEDEINDEFRKDT